MAEDAVSDQAPIREQVLPQLRVVLPRILAGRPVLAAYLYGSVAEGYARPESDVDVALVLMADHGLSSYQLNLIESRVSSKIRIVTWRFYARWRRYPGQISSATWGG